MEHLVPGCDGYGISQPHALGERARDIGLDQPVAARLAVTLAPAGSVSRWRRIDYNKFDEFRAKHQGANVQSESPADKQRMFREFLEWQHSEDKK